MTTTIVATTDGGHGQESTWNRTTSDLHTDTIPANAFKVPKDYKLTTMNGLYSAGFQVKQDVRPL